MIVGVEGMTLLAYQKNIGAPITIFGPVTGTRYRFGGKQKVGYVDNRDLKTGKASNLGLLEQREGRRLLFKVVTKPVKPPPKKHVEKPPELDVEPIETGAPAEEIPEVEALADIGDGIEPAGLGLWQDASEFTVAELRGFVKTEALTIRDLLEIRRQELDGKARVSALKAIEAAIASLSG